MRRLAFVLAALALPAAVAADPFVTLVDYTHGQMLAPTTPFVGSPLADEYVFDAPACYRRLVLDLRYEPHSAAVAIDGVGSVAVSYEFRAEVWRNATLVLDERVRTSGYGTQLGVLAEPGEHTLRLSLGWGADVDYTVRLRGAFLSGNETCNPPV